MRAESTQFLGFIQGIVSIREHIGNLDRLAFEEHPPGDAASSGCDFKILDVFTETWIEAVACALMEGCPLATEYLSFFSLAKPSSRRYECIEHGLQMARRAANNIEHLA